MLKKYPSDLNLIIKHFPLRMHRSAEKAALAGLAASRQGKYLEISKKFLENYKTLNDQSIRQYAEELGLDMAKFDKDCSETALKTIISNDQKLGMQLGVRGVPTLYINGKLVKQRTLAALSQMVEQELHKKKPQ